MNDDTTANQTTSSETTGTNEKHFSDGNKPLETKIVLSNNPDDPKDELATTNLNSSTDLDDPA